MPISHRVDRAARVLRLELTGTLQTTEMLSAIDRALADTGGERSYDVLSDHRGLAAAATPDQIMAIIAHLGTHAAAVADAHWAIVTALPASYGMMRMLSAYAAQIPIHVQVFQDLAAAEAWLGAPATTTPPVTPA